MEHIQAKKGNHKDESCSHQNNVPIPNLIEKNTTTQTYEVLICSLFLFTVLSSIYVANILCLADDVCIFYTVFHIGCFLLFPLYVLYDLNSSNFCAIIRSSCAAIVLCIYLLLLCNGRISLVYSIEVHFGA